MMIHKYVLELKACNVVEIPAFHKILDIQKQACDNVPLWAHHIATVQDGDYVWHFYD